MKLITDMRRGLPLACRVAGAALLVVGSVSQPAAPALAQMVCGSHADIERRLQTGYQETRTAIGVSQNGLVELYTSEKGSWTIVFTRPNGMSCLMAVGENWESVKDPKPVGNEL